MKHYIDPITQQLYAYASDGSQDEFIKPGLVPANPEQVAAIQAPPEPYPANIIHQILLLESTVTQRRVREAVLGLDNGWLANVDSQIAALRAQL